MNFERSTGIKNSDWVELFLNTAIKPQSKTASWALQQDLKILPFKTTNKFYRIMKKFLFATLVAASCLGFSNKASAGKYWSISLGHGKNCEGLMGICVQSGDDRKTIGEIVGGQKMADPGTLFGEFGFEGNKLRLTIPKSKQRPEVLQNTLNQQMFTIFENITLDFGDQADEVGVNKYTIKKGEYEIQDNGSEFVILF